MDKRLVTLTLLLLLGFGGNAAQGDLSAGLVGHWQFEGNFNDSAGANDGTAKGDAKIVTDPNQGQILELDGTGDYVEIPNSPALNLTGNQVSLAAWVKFNSVGPVQIIIAKVVNNTTHASPYFAYGLHTLANGQPRVWISRTGGAANRAGTAGMFKAETWHHVAGVYNGAQLRLYVDGKLAGSSNVTGNLIGYDTVLRLGTNGGLTEQMAGRMDDVRIYNRDLSEREVLSLATGLSLNKAWSPNPADEATDVTSPLFEWTAGEAAAFHNVYLGTTPELTEANLVASLQPLATYVHLQPLKPGTTYYWRVDEVEADLKTVHTGDVWSFSTAGLAIDPSLAGWWTFDDGEGTTAIDISGHERHGTLSGSPQWVEGALGKALDFEFSNTQDCVVVPPFDVAAGGITLSAWIKPESFSQADGRIIDKGTDVAAANDAWWMLSTVASSGQSRLRFRLKTNENATTATQAATSGNVVVGEWCHAAAVWNGTSMLLYQDGVEVGRVAKGGTAVAANPDAKVYIGNQLGGTQRRPWDGLIDDVRIYERALSELEIGALAGK